MLGATKVMNKKLTIHFTIPVSEEEWGGHSITFYKWIPESDTETILLNIDDRTIKVSVDKACVSHHGEVNDELINSWVNISVTKLYIEVELHKVDSNLVAFIYDERESPKEIHHGIQPGHDNYDTLSNKYKEIGVDVNRQA